MLFVRIRRVGALACLVAALGLGAPVGASAAVPGQPTPITITPEFASVQARSDVGPGAAGGVQVAQNRREIRRSRASNRRSFQRSSSASRAQFRRSAANDRRNDRRYDRRDYRRYSNYRGRSYGRPYYRDGYRHYYRGRYYTYRRDRWYDDGGAIVAAGVIGLAAGALVGSAYANNNTTVVVDDDYGYGIAPYSSAWYRACGSKYRSFRSGDGTYLGYDGLRHVCRIP